MKLLVGLGNPGPKYEFTRHNAGFWLVDALGACNSVVWENGAVGKFHGVLGKGSIGRETAIWLKPMTFMNLSGRSVLKVAQFFKIPPSDWVVFQDDIDLPDRQVKSRKGGGHGGHNGIRSIVEVTGQADFSRIKLGVGRPAKAGDGRAVMDVADYVLQPVAISVVEEYVKTVIPEVELRLKDLLR